MCFLLFLMTPFPVSPRGERLAGSCPPGGIPIAIGREGGLILKTEKFKIHYK